MIKYNTRSTQRNEETQHKEVQKKKNYIFFESNLFEIPKNIDIVGY